MNKTELAEPNDQLAATFIFFERFWRVSSIKLQCAAAQGQSGEMYSWSRNVMDVFVNLFDMFSFVLCNCHVQLMWCLLW